MDLFQHYQQLVRYDEWANLEMIGSFRNAGTPPPARSLKFMAHIIGAEHVWLARLLRREPPLPVWPELSLDGCDEQVHVVAAEWRNYLADHAAGLENSIGYKNSKGESWTSLVRDILTHVFMHSAYHRGQIAADMRQAGHVPAYTDFIHGVRQGLLE